jgi:hypothetical protein
MLLKGYAAVAGDVAGFFYVVEDCRSLLLGRRRDWPEQYSVVGEVSVAALQAATALLRVQVPPALQDSSRVVKVECASPTGTTAERSQGDG